MIIKPIPIEGLGEYWVSNTGYIFSMKMGKCVELKLRDDQNTRMRISLNVRGKGKRRFAIHRLVMLIFGPPQPEGMRLVRHFDGDYNHNYVWNL